MRFLSSLIFKKVRNQNNNIITTSMLLNYTTFCFLTISSPFFQIPVLCVFVILRKLFLKGSLPPSGRLCYLNYKQDSKIAFYVRYNIIHYKITDLVPIERA